MSMRDWGAGEGPRDKLLQRGAAALSDAELLAVVLRTGRRGCSAVDMARDLLGSHGSLGGLLTAPVSELLGCPGLGAAKLAQLQAALELAKRQALEEARALVRRSKARGYVRAGSRGTEHRASSIGVCAP